MGELINLNPGGIPDDIARDTEVAAAIAAHVAVADPHPAYLTQAEGDGRYRNTATPLTDADIPATIARDSEVTAAVNAHAAAANPHPIYLTQVEGDGRYRNTATPLTDADIPATIARDVEVAAAVSTATGNFGQLYGHTQFSDANTPVARRGWSFIGGAANTPTGNQTYRLNTALGAEYGIGTYALEIGIPRFGDKRLFSRRQEGGVWGDWDEFLPRPHGHSFNGTTVKSIGVSGGTFFSETNNCGYEIQARDTSSAAYLSFHRPGVFACHVGIDTDNQLKVGGWSFGGASYRIWHEGNLAPPQHLSKLITGNCPSTPGGEISISHGLNVAKIVGYTFMAFCPGRGWVLSESTAIAVGQFVHCQLGISSNFLIRVGAPSSSSGIYGQPFKIAVFYTP
jgi:hypothetical protein